MTRIIKKITPTAPKALIKKRVAAYARVSSGKDAMLQSLSAQISYYSEFIQKRYDWEYVGVYADEAATGTKDSRKEFQRLISDCRSGKIDMVITKSISRFARNTVTMLETVRELKSLNVDVYFEKENIHSISGDGELMLTILSSFAQAESLSVSENCKWRIRKRFAEGELVNLRFMYGYRIEKGIVKVNPKQAKIVRMIFGDYVSGLGCTAIASKLRRLGVKSLRGGIWNSDIVAQIIKNEKYMGDALLQKKHVSNHLTKKLTANKDALPKYYAEGTHPPIIDAATFQLAQEIMAENRILNEGKKAAGTYPFTSKIKCVKCGKNYKRKTTHGKAFWNCSTHIRYGKEACRSKRIPEGILRAVAADVLGMEVFDEASFKSRIREIQIHAPNQLLFVFNDGCTVQMEWQNKSRSESWSKEAKEKARERQMSIQEGGKENEFGASSKNDTGNGETL